MTRTQIRALEELAERQTMPVADGPTRTPGRMHPRTADALVRRDLAVLDHDDDGPTTWVTITDEGIAALGRAIARGPR